MTDLDNWKNFADYNYEDEDEETQKKKREIILKATLPSVTFVLIIIGLFVFKRQVLELKTRVTEWITVALTGLGINIGNRVSLSLDAIPSLGLRSSLGYVESIYGSGSRRSSVYPGSIFDSSSGHNSPPRQRYQSTRPLNLPIDQRGSADLRDMASMLVRPFFADPLPMFEFGSSSGTLSIGDDGVVTSTQIQSKTFTVGQPDEESVPEPAPTQEVRSPLRCLREKSNDELSEETDHDSPDTLDLMEPNPLELDLTDEGSNGSVVAFTDLVQVRELPKRTTRNKVPIYVAPSSDNEQ